MGFFSPFQWVLMKSKFSISIFQKLECFVSKLSPTFPPQIGEKRQRYKEFPVVWKYSGLNSLQCFPGWENQEIKIRDQTHPNLITHSISPWTPPPLDTIPRPMGFMDGLNSPSFQTHYSMPGMTFPSTFPLLKPLPHPSFIWALPSNQNPRNPGSST